jgi:hypothetical protein
MPTASQNTNAMTFPADGTELVRLTSNNQPLSTVLIAMILVCNMVNPSLIHSNKSMYKVSFIFVKTIQALFRDFHASMVLICCDFWYGCTFRASFTWIILKAGTATFNLSSPFLNC